MSPFGLPEAGACGELSALDTVIAFA